MHLSHDAARFAGFIFTTAESGHFAFILWQGVTQVSNNVACTRGVII
jgi:hypothetical protein